MHTNLSIKKSVVLNLIILILTFILIIFLLGFFVNSIDSDFENLAINNQTSVKYSNLLNNRKIHCGSPIDNKCLKDYTKFDDKELIVLLGNSQLHAINEMKKGDLVAPELLHQELLKKNKYLITYSAPNISILEKYIFLENLILNSDLKTLIISLVYDDTRESDIRDNFFEMINSKFEANLGPSITANIIINQKKNYLENNKKQEEGEYLSSYSEKYLEKNLKKYSVIWSNRHELRSAVYNLLYKIRNFVFDINSTSVRKKIQSSYSINMESLREIISTAKKFNVELLLYIAPIRHDISKPYNINDYKEFINEIKALSKENNVNFFNLETLVPDKFWGSGSQINFSDEKQYDFMHFKNDGHKLLSSKLNKLLN